MTTETNPGLERPLLNLAAALRHCPNVHPDDVSTLLEAARSDLRAWTETVIAEARRNIDPLLEAAGRAS